MKYRIGGVVFLLVALYLYRHGIHLPLAQMKAHAAEIKFSNKLIIFLPAIIGFALFLIFYGERMEHDPPIAFALAFIPLLALGIWWRVWFGHQMDLYGYGNSQAQTQPRVKDPEPYPEPIKATLAEDRIQIVDANQATHIILWANVAAVRVTKVGGDFYHPGAPKWYWSIEDIAGQTALISMAAISESQMMPEIHRLAGPTVYIRDHPADDAVAHRFDGPGSSWMVWAPKHAQVKGG